MKNYVLLICLSIFVLLVQGQSSLNFTVTQFPVLSADAGKDSVVKSGDKVRLGGSTVASGGSGLYQYAWAPITGLDSPFAAHPVATIDTSITYQLTVDDGKGCQKTSLIKVTVNRITATNDLFDKVGVSIFPNPSKGVFYIITEKPVIERKLLIELFDLYGRKIFIESTDGNRRLNKEVRVPTASKGLYILKVSGSKHQFTRKIILM